MHTLSPVVHRAARTMTSWTKMAARGWLALLLCSIVLLSACGGDAATQQKASQNKVRLDAQLRQAQYVGVPSSLLKPIQNQELQFSNTHAPLTLFDDQPATDYYRNLAKHYDQLTVQVQAVIATSTENAKSQAQKAVQTFQTTLAQRSAQGFSVDKFKQQFNLDQSQLAIAQYPKEYDAVTKNARTSVSALNLMLSTSAQLSTLHSTIEQMKSSNIDVTAIQAQYETDMQTFTNATAPADFQNLSVFINAQYQQAVVETTQAIPYVSAAKLRELEKQLNLAKMYGLNTAAYQKLLDKDRAAKDKATTIQQYTVWSKQIDADIASMHDDLVRGEANYIIKQFHQEVDMWGKAHLYHDKYDNQDYPLDNGYMAAGIGDDLDTHLSWATTTQDYQDMVDEANNALYNLRLLETDYNDKTPFDQVHATDTQLLAHYKLQKGKIVVVSLVEQALRLYQDGKLIRAFKVTTGRNELPSVPGIWPVLNRESPTTFKSVEPKGSPYWYPDTPINFAILYHWGGYFLHDSWWRLDYGPGTQYPHEDSGGDTLFAGNGSHGCVNMPEDQAGWLFNNTDMNTLIAIY